MFFARAVLVLMVTAGLAPRVREGVGGAVPGAPAEPRSAGAL